TVSRGESLFRTRCSACHVVGKGDGLARLGPNLVGVSQRRERAWLERWIAAPDEVLATQDPIATGLFEAYKRVPMPNMRLNELEIAALLEYIDGESQRALAAESGTDTPVAARACCMKKDELVLTGSASAAGATEAEPAIPSPAPQPLVSTSELA